MRIGIISCKLGRKKRYLDLIRNRSVQQWYRFLLREHQKDILLRNDKARIECEIWVAQWEKITGRSFFEDAVNCIRSKEQNDGTRDNQL